MPLPEGNYNAVELANYLTTHVYSAGPVYPLEVKYDPISLKFKFRCVIAGLRITLGLINGAAQGDDMNEELGFDTFNTVGDPFVERDGAGLQPYWNGYTNPPYYLFGDDVVDMTNSIRSLFLRTNLSTTSVLDSHIGGGFSNILTRVPINTEPGGIITIKPTDGDVHKLLLKVKAITDISITLTNQENQVINLNGLTFDISLKLEFIEDKELRDAPNRRLDYEKSFNDAQDKLQGHIDPETREWISDEPPKKPPQTKKKKTKKPRKKK